MKFSNLLKSRPINNFLKPSPINNLRGKGGNGLMPVYQVLASIGEYISETDKLKKGRDIAMNEIFTNQETELKKIADASGQAINLQKSITDLANNGISYIQNLRRVDDMFSKDTSSLLDNMRKNIYGSLSPKNSLFSQAFKTSNNTIFKNSTNLMTREFDSPFDRYSSGFSNNGYSPYASLMNNEYDNGGYSPYASLMNNRYDRGYSPYGSYNEYDNYRGYSSRFGG